MVESIQVIDIVVVIAIIIVSLRMMADSVKLTAYLRSNKLKFFKKHTHQSILYGSSPRDYFTPWGVFSLCFTNIDNNDKKLTRLQNSLRINAIIAVALVIGFGLWKIYG